MADGSRIKKLKTLYNERIMPKEEMEAHGRELFDSDDRLTAIIGGTLVEHLIESVLRVYMRSLSSDDDEAMFGANGILSSFSKTTRMAYALGFITDDQRHNANLIREIRNAFAHCFRPIKFDTKEVADVCEMLRLPNPNPLPANPARWSAPRHRFISAMWWTGRHLAALSRQPRQTPEQIDQPPQPWP